MIYGIIGLGIVINKALKHALQQCSITIPSKPNNTVCTACFLGKSHRLPSHTSTTVYTSPLQLVFVDLWGPASVQSTCGYHYFLTCVDAFSKYTWIYPLKAKSEAYTIFTQFKTMAELQYNHKLKAV